MKRAGRDIGVSTPKAGEGFAGGKAEPSQGGWKPMDQLHDSGVVVDMLLSAPGQAATQPSSPGRIVRGLLFVMPSTAERTFWAVNAHGRGTLRIYPKAWRSDLDSLRAAVESAEAGWQELQAI